MFEIFHLDSRTQRERLEQLGSKPKFWFQFDNRWLLFKAEERGTGDDWAEKIACELCELLELPHVHYDLAYDDERGIPGVVCETCAPQPYALGLGNQLLFALDPDYPQGTRHKVRQHTVDTVVEAVSWLSIPPHQFSNHLPGGIESALATFAGYVMLDAWIANQDRHHENWGALRDPLHLYLAPTFDHGASLARNLNDEERKSRLFSTDPLRQIPAFAKRARSMMFGELSSERTLTTFSVWQAFAKRVPAGARIWLDSLVRIDQGAIQRVIDQVPPQRMSQVSREFTLALLLENRRRLLSEEVET